MPYIFPAQLNFPKGIPFNRACPVCFGLRPQRKNLVDNIPKAVLNLIQISPDAPFDACPKANAQMTIEKQNLSHHSTKVIY